ncbi:MAG: response regulator transcription factor [Candidatus Promineofilum sp.]|nr:response regulator transcription factor [Promineifilum sp.]
MPALNNLGRGGESPAVEAATVAREAVQPARGPVATSLWLSIVSNSRLLCEGLELLLAPYLTFQLIGRYTAAAAPDAGRAPAENHVALIDNNIGPEPVRRWTRHWCGSTPPARVVVLEVEDNVDAIIGHVEAGISGYALVGAAPHTVAETILLASRGGAVCSPEVTARLFAHLAERPARRSSAELRQLLTAREYEVLGYVVEGYSNKEIAAELVIELRTVKQHVHNIFAKLNLDSRLQVARVAAKKGWFVD